MIFCSVQLLYCLPGQAVRAQPAAAAFEEARAAAKKHKGLWGQDLYGPLLLVDPATRQVVANFPDSAGVLTLRDGVYVGTLPDKLNLANTATRWSGTDWAMILLPLPETQAARVNLLVHELFHVAQPGLGFKLHNPGNTHLDKRIGRELLLLELEALKEALQAEKAIEKDMHLTHALMFRKHRHSQYPGAAQEENLLELNEGLAEYTGFAASGRKGEEAVRHFTHSINAFMGLPSYVRSFAYQTIPTYGYLLAEAKGNWLKKIKPGTDLTAFFISAFKVYLPESLEKRVGESAVWYKGESIKKKETIREDSIGRVLDIYRNKFMAADCLVLRLEKPDVSFDPRNLVPIDILGTVYPTLTVTDLWGSLTVEKGALISTAWDKLTLTVPLGNNGPKWHGDGWVLELGDGYRLAQKEGVAFLQKQE